MVTQARKIYTSGDETMTKKENIENRFSCLNKADLDEPIFVLRGQDKLAPVAVRLWAELAAILNCGKEKVYEAREVANKMEIWYNRKYPD
jgi:hypothetical protein